MPHHTEDLRDILLSSLLVVGLLSLVQFSNFSFSVTLHRVVQPTSLSDASVILPACLIVLIIYGVLEFYTGQGIKPHIHLIALLTTPLIGIELALGTSAILAAAIGLYNWRRFSEAAYWTLITFIALEITALTHWLLIYLGLQSPLSPFAAFELNLYYIIAILTPITLISTLYYWAARQLLKKYTGEYDADSKSGYNLWDLRMILFSAALALFALIYSASPEVNPHGLLLGYDFDQYLKYSPQVMVDPQSAFKVMSGDRPVTFLIIYLIQYVTRLSVYNTLYIIPFIFLPLLVLAAGLLGWEIFRRGDVAAWFSFFTGTGIFLIEAVYGYFISNIIGLLLVYLWLALMLRGLRRGNRVMLITSLAFGVLAYFSHPWTAELYFGCLAIYWALSYSRRLRPSFNLRRIILLSFIVILALGLLHWYINGNMALLIPYQLLQSFRGFTTLDLLRDAGTRGEYTLNVILLSLAVVGLLRLKHKTSISLYLGVLFAVSGVVFLFLNDVVRFRLFIVLPLGLVAALGMVDIINKIESNNLKRVFTCFILLFFVVYLLRSMANLI